MFVTVHCIKSISDMHCCVQQNKISKTLLCINKHWERLNNCEEERWTENRNILENGINIKRLILKRDGVEKYKHSDNVSWEISKPKWTSERIHYERENVRESSYKILTFCRKYKNNVGKLKKEIWWDGNYG